MAKPWLNLFLSDLNAGQKAQALERLVLARRHTQGLGGGWGTALVACIQAGWLEGCEKLIEWEVQLPKAHMPHRRPTIREKAMRHAKYFEKSRDALIPDVKPFRLPNGEPTAPLSSANPRDLYRILFVSDLPPMTPAEWAAAMEEDMFFALDKLEAGEVSPWGGTASCRAMVDVLGRLLKERSRPARGAIQALEVLRGFFPARLKTHANRLLGDVLAALYAQTEGRLTQYVPKPDEEISPLIEALDIFRVMGFSMKELQQKTRAQVPEDLFVLSVRHNSPDVFLAMLDEDLLPWESKPYPRMDRQGSVDTLGSGDVFQVLAKRIHDAPPQTRQQWWHVAARVFGQQAIPRPMRHKAQVATAVFLDSLEKERWEALVLQMRLERELEGPDPEGACEIPTRARL